MVVVALVLYVANAVVLTASFVLHMSATHATPWPPVLVAALVALVFVALVFGVWVGREVPRWALSRIGLGIGLAVLLGGVIGVALWFADSDTSSVVLWLAVLNLISGVLQISGGLLLHTGGVRAWCAKAAL
ncbi:MAG: hypothetical protein GEV07_18430 [Streptosporangiales bacterium]|nr:hypothetical protein [Streptosporangiales bacterium]